MIEWAKFFFGSFFSNKITIAGQKRSFFNAVLALFLMMLLVFGGIVAGHAASFPTFYDRSDEFKAFVQETFSNNSLTISGNTAKSDTKINTFAERTGNADNYQLVIDTDNTSKSYSKFEVTAKSEGRVISYESYRNLKEEEKKNYKLDVKLTSEKIVYDAELERSMREYVAGVSDANSASFNSVIAKDYNSLLQEKDLTRDEMFIGIYALYVRAYYPAMTSFGYSTIPTLSNYYLACAEGCEKYIIILDDFCIGSFYSGNTRVEFNGFYSKLNGVTVNADNARDFIMKSFSGYGNMRTLVYVINLLQTFPYFLIVWIASALIFMAVAFIAKIGYAKNLFNDFTMCGVYMFIAGVAAFIATFICSFFVTRAVAYSIACITFYIVYSVRCLVLIIPETVKQVKKTSS